MHIIFGEVSGWQVSFIKLLKYFKLKVYYFFIESKSEFEKNKIADDLAKKNITPVPIEFGKNIPSETFSLFALDNDEISYKRNINMIPDRILKGYCDLFSIDGKRIKKLRLMLQDVVGSQMAWYSSRCQMWATLNPSTKIIFVNFKLINFFIPKTNSNIFKIIIPLDIFFALANGIKKLLNVFFLKVKKEKNSKNKILNEENLDQFDNKTVSFITHKGLIYGSKVNKIFEKTLYYSEDTSSHLNKYNILHFDYSDYPCPEKNICWISLSKMDIYNIQIFLKTLIAGIRTSYLIRGWKTFLVWLLLIKKYDKYMRYCEIIKKFKKIKIAIIDHDYLCPKTLILALEKNNIKTVATQDRFITTYYKSFYNIMVDTYYVASENIKNFIKNSKYHDVKNIIPVGLYRSDYLSLYKNKDVPKEIALAKKGGKKILIVLGNNSPSNKFESYVNPIASWSAQLNFLENFLKLAEYLNDTFIALRYKNLDWLKNNKHFEDIMKRINNCENMIISNCQDEALYGYKLCANADLIITQHTSLGDECLSKGIPVLFYDFTHNIQKVVIDIPNYLPPALICYNFEELLEKSKSLLFDNSSRLTEEINKLSKTVYDLKEKGNIKKKIIGNLENLLFTT